MQKHTLIDSVTERRNYYQGRMAENMVNIIYFGKRKEKLIEEQTKLKEGVSSKDARKSAKNVKLLQEKNMEISQADVGIKRAEKGIGQDKMLIKSFDELLKTLK